MPHRRDQNLIKRDVIFPMKLSLENDTTVVGSSVDVAPGEFKYIDLMGVLRDGQDAQDIQIFFIQAERRGDKIEIGAHARDHGAKPGNSHAYSFKGHAYFMKSK